MRVVQWCSAKFVFMGTLMASALALAYYRGSPLEADSFLPFVCQVEQRNLLHCLCFGILQICSEKMLRKRLWECSNSSVPAGVTRAYGNAVPTQNYSRERRSHAFLLHYTPGAVFPSIRLCHTRISPKSSDIGLRVVSTFAALRDVMRGGCWRFHSRE